MNITLGRTVDGIHGGCTHLSLLTHECSYSGPVLLVVRKASVLEYTCASDGILRLPRLSFASNGAYNVILE